MKSILTSLVMVSSPSVLWSMTLSDQLLSPNFYGSQGAISAIRQVDALSWAQNPSLLADSSKTQVSSGTYLVFPNLNPKPSEKSALGTQVIGLTAEGLSGTFGVALSMPLGQNVWVDTGSRESTALFGLSRMSAFSVGLGWARHWGNGWSAGLQIPILFRSNTTTDIYLTEERPWSRARTGVQPYLGWHLGVKKEWDEGDSHLAIAYREEQASKIEFAVKGEVDFAGITLPLDAAGLSEILFEPRRVDIQYQNRLNPKWTVGLFGRWSHWRSAPTLGLVIDSKIPKMKTQASQVSWQDQWEISAALAHHFEAWAPVLSYRYRTRAVLSSNDYWDYDEHVLGAGAHAEVISRELWVSVALRLHKHIGDGSLISVLAGFDWVL